MTDLFRDYDYYTSGNESPREYHMWACFSMVAAIVQWRFAIERGGEDAYEQNIFTPQLYVCLVGPMGQRKSFAKDIVADTVIGAHFVGSPDDIDPGIYLGASLGSSEEILQAICDDEQTLRKVVIYDGSERSTHPMYLMIDELVNFISVNPQNMVARIVGIYGRRFFDYRFKNAGRGESVMPCVNILACATTDYIVDKIRDKILSGGIARRMLFINHSQHFNWIAKPMIPKDGKAALMRVVNHLKKLQNMHGKFTFDCQATEDYYAKWYEGRERPVDSIMSGFMSSEHMQVLKIAMLIALGDYKITEKSLVITLPILEEARAIIDAIKPGMMNLFGCAGRNELAAPTMKILELLSVKGFMRESDLHAAITGDLGPWEQMQVLEFLMNKTKKICQRELTFPQKDGAKVKVMCYCTMEWAMGWDKKVAEARAKVVDATKPPSSTAPPLEENQKT